VAERIWDVYLSGEIHSDWRERIEAGAHEAGLPIAFSAPVTDHAAQATARTAEQVVDVLRYVIEGRLP
jgi:nucleoside 2-deoxyribosyltransferase YtoQ